MWHRIRTAESYTDGSTQDDRRSRGGGSKKPKVEFRHSLVGWRDRDKEERPKDDRGESSWSSSWDEWYNNSNWSSVPWWHKDYHRDDDDDLAVAQGLSQGKSSGSGLGGYPTGLGGYE